MEESKFTTSVVDGVKTSSKVSTEFILVGFVTLELPRQKYNSVILVSRSVHKHNIIVQY